MTQGKQPIHIRHGQAVNLSQLQGELAAANVDYGMSLLRTGQVIHAYDNRGMPQGFEDRPAAQAVLDAHVALRDKNDAEYSAEFNAPETTPERRQQIRDILLGLEPRELVPMESVVYAISD